MDGRATSRDHNAPLVLSPAMVIERLRHLPPIPAVVSDLLVAIDRPDVNAGIIASKLGRDQALAARTLRMANSPFFGLRTRVVSMREVINVIGMSTLRTVVLAASVIGHLRPAPGSSFGFEAFWRHSLATAVAAGQLARHLRADAQAAFMAGLLHDIGRLVLVTCFPAQYQEVIRRRTEYADSIAAEHAIFGLDHVRVGIELTRHWNFPPLIAEAIGAHHEPFTEGPLILAELVAIADCAARNMGYVDDVGDLGDSGREAFAARVARVNLSAGECIALLETIRQEVDFLGATLAAPQ